MNGPMRFLLPSTSLLALMILGWTANLWLLPQNQEKQPQASTWVEEQLARLTMQQKVAQLFAASARGYYTSTDDPAYHRLIDLVENFEVGGLVFFQGDPLSQAMLLNDLQARASLPLLISQDMEWGAGMRIEHTTSFPRAMALGATRDPDLAYALGYVTAREARALGTHQIFAPVADVNNNPANPNINVRSFGEQAGLVADMVSAFVEGAQDGGVIATLKHFPGHGDTALDSHSDLPVLTFSRTRLDTLELVPFRAALDAGAMSVMTAHVALPALEPDVQVPSSLSYRVTHELLREELNFQGLIVTDAMNMRGVTKHHGTGEAAVRALEAGADMILLSPDAYAGRRAILQALEEGRVTEERVDASVRRILRAKEWAGLPQNRQVALDDVRHQVATQAHTALNSTIARRSLTLLGNEAGLLPLTHDTGRVLVLTLSDNDDPTRGQLFVQTFREHAPHLQLTPSLIDRGSSDGDYAEALRSAAQHDVVLLPTYLVVRSGSDRITLPDTYTTFLNNLLATGKPIVLISFGNPYLVMGLAQPPAAYLAAYGSNASSEKAVVQALLGQSTIEGTLPITIPGTYAYGDGVLLEQGAIRPGYPEEVGLESEALARIDSLIRAAIENRAFPGAAVAVGRGDVVAKLQGYGYHTYAGETPVTPQSLYDLASLTKVIATTTAAMKLYEEGHLDLEAPVARYVPAFGQNGKGSVTIQHLITHTSGLPAFRPFHTLGLTSRQAVLDAILAMELTFPPGSDMRYSDLGMITMMLVVEQITGQDFGTYTREHIFEPLGMYDTGFRPVGKPDPTVVPTENDTYFRNRLMQGEVHDEAAWILGGTSGHAGLFSTAHDLARFGYMLVKGGRVNGKAFLQEETLRLFTRAVDPEEHTRALGWDTRSMEGYSSAGRHFGPNSFGHTGFTGTSFWVDPDQDLFVILLANRVYPTRENQGHVPIRPQLADLAYEALRGEPALLKPHPPRQR